MTPIANLVNIMTLVQSSPIDVAAKSERNWLFMLVAWAVISALVTGALTVLLYKKTGRYQDAVRRDADARIAEADSKAAVANENAGKANERAGIANERAAEANERAAALEKQNIQLRTDLESATAESRTRQAELAREQSKLADEQRKTAEAQRAADEARLALQQHLELVAQNANPRLMSGEQLLKIKRFLERVYKDPPPITVEVKWNKGDPEALDFAGNVNDLFLDMGWKIAPMASVTEAIFPLQVAASDNNSPVVNAVVDAFLNAGFEIGRKGDPNIPPDRIVIVFGPQPKRRFLWPNH